MQYIFETTACGLVDKTALSTHPYKAVVCLEQKALINKKACDAAEAWLDSVRLQLRLQGITDVFCMSNVPSKIRKEAYSFSFYFADAAQCFQFQAANYANLSGTYVRSIEAATENISHNQETRIRQFCESEGIYHESSRQNSKVLLVVTKKRQDDLIIAMHIAKRTFDDDMAAQTKISALLQSLEHA